MTTPKDDPVKKIFGKSTQEIFSAPPTDHTKYHSANAFCGNAGPEEMKHFYSLLDELTDVEVSKLVDAVGITFGKPTVDIDRDTLEGVLDETDREVFYREYRKLMDERKLLNQDGIDRISQQYAKTCQAYITDVEQRRLSLMDGARYIRNEEPDKPLHPMLRSVAAYAFDIVEDMWGKEDSDRQWKSLKWLVSDFLASSWYTTYWALSGTYMHNERTHGLSFNVKLRDPKPHVEIADKEIQEAVEMALSKLNPKQTTERFLQNALLVLPKEISAYSLEGLTIKEYLADK
jgi:hypothetical protein